MNAKQAKRIRKTLAYKKADVTQFKRVKSKTFLDTTVKPPKEVYRYTAINESKVVYKQAKKAYNSLSRSLNQVLQG